MLVYMVYGTLVFRNVTRRSQATTLLNSHAQSAGMTAVAHDGRLAGVSNIEDIGGKPALTYNFQSTTYEATTNFMGDVPQRYNLDEDSSWGVSLTTV